MYHLKLVFAFLRRHPNTNTHIVRIVQAGIGDIRARIGDWCPDVVRKSAPLIFPVKGR